MKLEKIIPSLILITFILGYILGIVKFVRCDFDAPYKAEVLYGIGIVTGYNVILGWINLGK